MFPFYLQSHGDLGLSPHISAEHLRIVTLDIEPLIRLFFSFR